MPKITTPAEFDLVINAIRHQPDGARFETIHSALDAKIAKRTLQRRLSELAMQGRLVREGRNRGALYRIARESQIAPALREPEPVTGIRAELYVPMSTEGVRLRDLVRRPSMLRTPVGYNRDFLLNYIPNETWYLPSKTRFRLHQMGERQNATRQAGTYARDVLSRLLIDLSWASSKLEGNTYTLLDTERLIEHGEIATGKDADETQMILNHKRAIEFLVEEFLEVGFNLYTFQNLHAMLSENLLAKRDASGRLRQHIVEISGTVFRPLAIPQQIDEFFRIILDKAAAIGDPFEQSFFLMVHVPYLQPFADVNKRVSRLGANIPLIKNNLCPLSFIEVPERAYIEGTLAVYELNQVELLADVFEWAYERSCQQYRAIADSLPVPDPFRRIYREAMADVLGQVVRQGWRADPAVVEGEAEQIIPIEHRQQFVQMVIDELKGLHEGNIARYRLRLAVFREWKVNKQ